VISFYLSVDGFSMFAFSSPCTTLSHFAVGFEIRRKVGRTVLRPGSTAATDKLHSWIQRRRRLFPDDTTDTGTAATSTASVLELASGLGQGGMRLASKYGYDVLLTDTDRARLDRAAAEAERRGLDGLVSTRILDMNKIGEQLLVLSDDADNSQKVHFDAAILEACTTHLPLKAKTKVVRDVGRVSDQILLHEMCFRDNESELSDDDILQIKRDMSSRLRIGFEPMRVGEWKALLETNGFDVRNCETGPMRLLDPLYIVKDEGLTGLFKIAYNLFTQPRLRKRILETRQALADQYSDKLGYIILHGVRRRG